MREWPATQESGVQRPCEPCCTCYWWYSIRVHLYFLFTILILRIIFGPATECWVSEGRFKDFINGWLRGTKVSCHFNLYFLLSRTCIQNKIFGMLNFIQTIVSFRFSSLSSDSYRGSYFLIMLMLGAVASLQEGCDFDSWALGPLLCVCMSSLLVPVLQSRCARG